MTSVAQLKSHIRSVNNTKQITSAMQLVAASKMRRAVSRSLATQPYNRYLNSLLVSLAGQEAAGRQPLMSKREVKNKLLIVIASDTGLAGAYNSNVLKYYLKELNRNREAGIKVKTIAIGRKAIRLASRLGEDVIGTYEGMSAGSVSAERGAIVATVIDEFLAHRVDAVDIIYTNYHSPVSQEVNVWKLLPAGQTNVADETADAFAEESEFIFEPSRDEVLDALTKRAIEVQVAQTLFDSVASEHSTRMLAMKNATDNAEDLSRDLTLIMNKARQSAITTELSDINNGANAVE